MELKTVLEIENAIDALSPQELAQLYVWLDRHRHSTGANAPSLDGDGPAVPGQRAIISGM